MAKQSAGDLLTRWREQAEEALGAPSQAPKVLAPKTEREWEEQVSGRLAREHPLGPAPYGDLGSRPY